MYLTHSPCEPCAGMMINAGIASVTYAMPYRDGGGVARLILANLQVSRAKGYGDVE